jgi:hypothetical protein
LKSLLVDKYVANRSAYRPSVNAHQPTTIELSN